MRVRMCLIGLVPAMVALSLSTQAFSQEWIESVHIESRFTANLPEEPIMDEYTMTSEYGPTLPVRRYTAHDQYGGRYVVTVTDYEGTQVTNARGAVAYATQPYRHGPGEITFDAYHQVDRIEGHMLQITNPDESRTYVAIHLHYPFLYTLEATVPPDSPPPIQFQQSLRILDAEGNRVRYTIDHDGQRTESSIRPLEQ